MKVDSFMHHIPLALRNDGLMLAGEGLALVDNVALLHPVVQPLVDGLLGEGCGLGVHRGVPLLVDDTSTHALNDEKARKKIMPTASLARLAPFNLINCNLCDSNRLYATRTPAAGVLP